MRIKNGALVDPLFVYNSENNKDYMSSEYLRTWITNNRQKIGKI